MISFNDIKKLDIYGKASIISIALMFPFWYISLYLFGKNFYNDSDLYLRIIFALCFSIMYYMYNLIFSMEMLNINFQKQKKYLFITTGLRSNIYLIVGIAVNYKYTVENYEGFLESVGIYTASIYIL